MNKIKRYIQFVKRGSAKKLVLTFGRTVWYNGRLKFQKFFDEHYDTRKVYANAKRGLNCISIAGDDLDYTGINRQKAKVLWEMYSQHRFDLLGSGWVKSNFAQESLGFAGYKYQNIPTKADAHGLFLAQTLRQQSVVGAKRIYSQIEGEYEPIDWQKDFKSGYRWGADKWYRPQETAKLPGGDIKVPWELSRLQHLPRLAILSKVLPEKRANIYKEFRNQLLDFIAQNPVRMGVNHMCTMDVGIRVANIALACSLWKGVGQEFDFEFEQIVTNYLFEECNFIRNNLEWSYYLTSNHYFADIAGLLWGSAVLPQGRLRKKWLYFAANEINKEVIKQFNKEGSNGEGSTAYHRLTSEMAIYSLMLMMYLNQHGEHIKINKEAVAIIKRAGDFSNAILRPDMMFTQIGDNDSGLFFRLSITGDLITSKEAKEKYSNLVNYEPQEINEMYLDENMNDCRTFLSSAYGMYEDEKLLHAKEQYPLEASLITQLIDKKTKILPQKEEIFLQNSQPILQHHSTYEISSNGLNLLEELERIDYPQFGIYLFKGKNIYLCVNASDNGQKGNAGHAHNDKLSFELFIGNKCIYEDCGTYVYTAMPEIRDEFRSTQKHNTIFVGIEQNEYNGLFSMNSRTKCSLLNATDYSITIQLQYENVIQTRKFIVMEEKLVINDACNLAFGSELHQEKVTRGYGKLLI